MSLNLKDIGTGIFFIAVGLVYGSIAYKSLPIGEALSMGPGYFPILLSGILVAIGLVALGQGIFIHAGAAIGNVSWRGIAMISAALILFAALLHPLGLLLTVFITVFVSSRASPEVSLLRGTAIGAGVAALTTVIFIYGVRMPLPLFGSWFAGY